VTSIEEPEQDRRRRDLPWLLLGCLALVLLLLADLGGWMITRDEARTPGVVAGGTLPVPPRSVTGAGGGPILHMGDRDGAAVTAGHDLVVTSRVSGLLVPGRSRPLVVTVRNAGRAAVRLTGVHVTVQPIDARCKAGWFSVTGGVPAGTTVAAGARTDLSLRLLLRDEPVNQNSCKAQRVPFNVSIDGVRAGP